MNHNNDKKRTLLLGLALCVGLGLAAACDDGSPSAPDGGNGTTPPPPPPPASSGLVRAAQLTIDARTVDVAIDGSLVFPALSYPGVSNYVELPAGPHRIQFLPAGSTGAALREMSLDVAANAAVTVAIVGRATELVVVSDDLGTSSGEARLKLFNAVPDFPANFDVRVVNGERLFEDVAYRARSSQRSVIPGLYTLSLNRGGTEEQLVTLGGVVLQGGSASTVFAVGSLGRNDMQLFVARDR